MRSRATPACGLLRLWNKERVRTPPFPRSVGMSQGETISLSQRLTRIPGDALFTGTQEEKMQNRWNDILSQKMRPRAKPLGGALRYL